MFTNTHVNSLSTLLNSFRVDSAEKIESIAVAINNYDLNFVAVLYHKDGFSFSIVSDSKSSLIEKVKNYLDPWRQKED